MISFDNRGHGAGLISMDQGTWSKLIEVTGLTEEELLKRIIPSAKELEAIMIARGSTKQKQAQEVSYHHYINAAGTCS